MEIRFTLAEGLARTFLVRPLKLKMPILYIALWLLLVLIVFFVVVPSLYNILWAFWGSEIIGILGESPSFSWFHLLLSDSSWRLSLLYSILLAILVSLVGCFVLVLHFYFMRYMPARLGSVGYILTLIPVTAPAVI